MGLFISADEIVQTIHMIQEEHLDIRTVTMGINLLDCIRDDIDKTCAAVYDKICRGQNGLCLNASLLNVSWAFRL